MLGVQIRSEFSNCASSSRIWRWCICRSDCIMHILAAIPILFAFGNGASGYWCVWNDMGGRGPIWSRRYTRWVAVQLIHLPSNHSIWPSFSWSCFMLNVLSVLYKNNSGGTSTVLVILKILITCKKFLVPWKLPDAGVRGKIHLFVYNQQYEM